MKKIFQYSIFAFLPLYFSAQDNAQTYPDGDFLVKSSAASARDVLNNSISTMFTDPVMRNAQWGFVVYDPKTKKVINSYNENASLIPASTTKLLTTEAAMSLFGKDYQWVTQLEYSGDIDENGILNGNLYIIGSNDPSLGIGRAGASTYGALVSDFVKSIKELGIKRVKGDIILKTAVFRNNKNTVLPANIVWKGSENYFLPAGSTNDTDPRHEKLLGNKKTDNYKYIYVSPYTQNIVYTENFGGFALSTKLPDAPVYLANNLKTSLAKNGIPTEGKVIDKSEPQNTEEERKKITAGFYKEGNYSLDTGKATVNKHLTKKTFDFQGFNYADGSGLSRSNVITPMSQVKFLSELMNEKHFDSYFKSLPIGGQTGTLRSMFLNTEAYGQVFAKTGTLNRVKTLAGYIKTKKGKLLTFSLLINNYNGSVAQVKKKMESILIPILDLK